MKTNIYVDGFNLYYGCLKDTPYRWLDIASLCRNLLNPTHVLGRIRYFTAKTRPTASDPNIPLRQGLYLRALRTIPGLSIHEGRFLSHKKWMPLSFEYDADEKWPGPPLNPRPREAMVVLTAPGCTGSMWRDLASPGTRDHLAVRPHPGYGRVLKFEEKGSDVNLATYLLLDAFRHDFECAVVVSNDSDLIEPIHIVRKELKLPVGVINPHRNPSYHLKKAAKFLLQVNPIVLAQSQFPDELTNAAGKKIRKPSSW